MTKETHRKMTGITLLALAAGGLGLAGCASPAPTRTTAAGAGAGATTRVAATNAPGVGKGHWEIESTPMVGTFARRRVWVPDDGSASVVDTGTSNAQSLGANALRRTDGSSVGGGGR